MLNNRQHERFLFLREKNKLSRLSKLLNETLEMLPKDRVCVNTDSDPNWYDNEEDLTQEQLEAL